MSQDDIFEDAKDCEFDSDDAILHIALSQRLGDSDVAMRESSPDSEYIVHGQGNDDEETHRRSSTERIFHAGGQRDPVPTRNEHVRDEEHLPIAKGQPNPGQKMRLQEATPERRARAGSPPTSQGLTKEDTTIGAVSFAMWHHTTTAPFATSLLQATFAVPAKNANTWIQSLAVRYDMSKAIANALGKTIVTATDQCRICDKKHQPAYCPIRKILGKAGTPIPQCCYFPRCSENTTHSTRFCPRLNNRCETCQYRGHVKEDNICTKYKTNFTAFEEHADEGYVTARRHRKLGCLAGFFPVTRVSLAAHLDLYGGYKFLKAFPCKEAAEIILKCQQMETVHVGMEPHLTEKVTIDARERFRIGKTSPTSSTASTPRLTSSGASTGVDEYGEPTLHRLSRPTSFYQRTTGRPRSTSYYPRTTERARSTSAPSHRPRTGPSRPHSSPHSVSTSGSDPSQPIYDQKRPRGRGRTHLGQIAPPPQRGRPRGTSRGATRGSPKGTGAPRTNKRAHSYR